MKKIFVSFLGLFLCVNLLFAGGPEDSLNLSKEELKFIDSVESAMKWQTGTVMVGNNTVKLTIPQGFKFLDAEQSKYLLHDIWGNPPQEGVWGMIFPEDGGPWAQNSYTFVLTFEETGFIKDKDADDINYGDMLKDMQSSEKEVNAERQKQGYEAIHILRWAQSPYYDKNRKVLHWAKEIQFGNEPEHTLNYDVRVLGRKGVLSLNAISSIKNLDMVKANINKVLAIPEFTEGNRYSDFNSSTDKVAEYGLGALVAGGVLAKTGVLATIGKFFIAAWKFIVFGVVALIAGIKKFFTKKKEDDTLQPEITNEA
ncbi:MAG: DUF2167 domain-containing protein [Ferruginibacter sp.]